MQSPPDSGNYVSHSTIIADVTLFNAAQFSVASSSTGPKQTLKWFREGPMGNDRFAVARGEKAWLDKETGAVGFVDNFHDIVNAVVDFGLCFPDFNFPYLLNHGQGWNTGSTFHFRKENKVDFLNTLASYDFSNFFWFGHGNPNSIGYGVYDYGLSKKLESVGMTAEEISGKLGNRGLKYNHPYRFVFLHGCSTASGGALSKAFGIPDYPVGVDYFSRRGRLARAFIGLRDICAIPDSESEYAYALNILFVGWSTGGPLNHYLDVAKTRSPSNQSPLPPEAVILGAVNLTRSSP
ncbi:MAG: hypothetical protein SFY81_01275 [Verrucomicrobiota bacterium]|nr:hypothetical protein [Verrucomicrobiota bacterium]